MCGAFRSTPTAVSVVGSPRKVTATSALQWSPSASENGRRLVFQSDRLATGGLWIRDLEADRAEVLLVSSRGAIGPVITADGSRVAYVDTEKNWAIYAVPSSGGEAERVCADCGDGFVSCRTGQETRCDYCTLSGLPRSSSSISDRATRGAHFSARRMASGKRNSPRTTAGSAFSRRSTPKVARKLWVVPFRDGSVPKADEWVGRHPWRALGRQATLVAGW